MLTDKMAKLLTSMLIFNLHCGIVANVGFLLLFICLLVSF